MGVFASVDQLTARFASNVEAAYATDNEAAGVISPTVAAECIGTADGEILSYWGVRYSTTAADIALALADAYVAALMLGVALDMAEFHVLNRAPDVPDQKTRQYERRLEWLKMLAEGKVSIPGAVEIPSATVNVQDAAWSTWDRTYSDDDVRDVSRATAGGI